MRIPRNLSLVRRMRDARLRQLGRLGPLVGSSLVALPRRSSRYLTDEVAGRTRTLYIPIARLREVRKWNDAHRCARHLVRELSELQRAMLRMEIRSLE